MLLPLPLLTLSVYYSFPVHNLFTFSCFTCACACVSVYIVSSSVYICCACGCLLLWAIPMPKLFAPWSMSALPGLSAPLFATPIPVPRLSAPSSTFAVPLFVPVLSSPPSLVYFSVSYLFFCLSSIPP